MTPIVLVHGGGLDHRCWDLLVPHLKARVLAVDLPGRGRSPAPLSSVTLRACADSVVDDVDRVGFDGVVLVGHSLAGCSLPFVAQRLGTRTRHAVFIAATVPPDGQSAFDTLEPEIQALVLEAGPDPQPATMSGEVAALVLGDGLDEDQLRWCTERLVPEAPKLTTDPVSLAGLAGVTSTWIRTMEDLIVAPDKQARFARNLGQCEIVDLDAGHMCMVSRPAHLAALLDAIAESHG